MINKRIEKEHISIIKVVHKINALYSMSSEIQQYPFEEFRPLISTQYKPIHSFVHFKNCVNYD